MYHTRISKQPACPRGSRWTSAALRAKHRFPGPQPKIISRFSTICCLP